MNANNLEEINKRLSNGEDPKSIFDDINSRYIKKFDANREHKKQSMYLCCDFKNGFTQIYIPEKGFNFITIDNKILWKGDQWFDACYDFENGLAKIHAFEKGWNYLKTDGTLLWNDYKWLDDAWDFKNGFARVQYKREWCRLTQSGDLISTKQYFQQIEQRLANGEDPKKIFSYVGEFENGFAIVRLDRIGWNFLKADGTLLWNGDKWFTWCYNFENKSASVKYNGAIYRITESCDLIPIDQYVQQIRQRISDGEDTKSLFDWCDDFKDGFARVRINGKGENFLKPDGTLLWNDDTWLDLCEDLNGGFARIKLYEKGFNYLKTDGTRSEERRV